MNPCACISLTSYLQSQLESLSNILRSLSTNFHLPSTDSGIIPQSTNGPESTDTSFNDNLTGAFYLMFLFMSILMISRMFKSFTQRGRAQSSKLN